MQAHAAEVGQLPVQDSWAWSARRKVNLYLVDATQLPVVRQARDQYVNTQQPPASTAVEVRRLVRDDLLIEVEASPWSPRLSP